MSRRTLPVILWFAFLAACGQAVPATPLPSETQGPILEPFIPSATLTPTWTVQEPPTLAEDTPTAQATPTPLPLPTMTTSAMQLFFPTVVPAEGAEYRPPLYPVPWALSPNDHFYFTRPISAFYPSEPVWDYRYGGIYFGPDVIHSGIDLPAPRGTDVLAAGPGTVVWAGVGLFTGSPYNVKDPYGLVVAIRHDFGYNNLPLYTVYAHLDEIDVALGQWLDTGDVLGNVGSTGNTTGPHLHFEVRLGKNDFWSTRNPELWIAPPQGTGVLVGRIMNRTGWPLHTYLVMLKDLATGKNYVLKTYAELTAIADPYYNENVAIGDLPAGLYEINIPYGSLNRLATIQIYPGQINYFAFYGYGGYDFAPPEQQLSTPIP